MKGEGIVTERKLYKNVLLSSVCEKKREIERDIYRVNRVPLSEGKKNGWKYREERTNEGDRDEEKEKERCKD